eukprot:4975520-Prymnesium_polylepis.1
MRPCLERRPVASRRPQRLEHDKSFRQGPVKSCAYHLKECRRGLTALPLHRARTCHFSAVRSTDFHLLMVISSLGA